MGEHGHFKVATFNVHGWTDGRNEDNLERVAALVRAHDPDVLCLQECRRGGIPSFFKKLLPNHFPWWLKNHSCAIFSKFEMAQTFAEESQLHHRTESKRLEQLEFIYTQRKHLFEQLEYQIWCGDFNALTFGDYNQEELECITQTRAKNSWELPVEELTQRVNNLGLVDSWAVMSSPPPLKTCRFDTRIDYIFISPTLMADMEIKTVEHIDKDTSDHNMVLAELVLRS
eukprot:maker-scaffold804_size94796-snap-gene-0.18 protein:Tk06339 transcript:maker-scaffold804_size94796-snap-gene-0.18-mRNA-1 annotation:"hypothetical protein GUITHDRAFT_152728"